MLQVRLRVSILLVTMPIQHLEYRSILFCTKQQLAVLMGHSLSVTRTMMFMGDYKYIEIQIINLQRLPMIYKLEVMLIV